MVTRVGLVVALAFITVPATLMGSTTYYFIRENPDWSATLTGDTAVWRAEIIEMEADSTPSAPDSFVTTDTVEIHSLGLQTPSEDLGDADNSPYIDWHSDWWHNRQWASWTIPGSLWWPSGQHRKTMTVGSGTYRPTIPGPCYVRCNTYRNGASYWDLGWKGDGHWYITNYVMAKTYDYPYGEQWSWHVYGSHWWGSGATYYSEIQYTW